MILVRQGDAFNLDFIEDGSVDLVVTSPPYFAVRAYKSEGKVIDVVGNEPSPLEYVDSLVTWMQEMRRVLKPAGNVFVVLGDKYAGSGGHNNSAIGASKDRGPGRYNQESNGIRSKSLMGLPWRFANAAVDDGWILRAEIVWAKPNGMPESVQDRVRRSHESIFHFTKEGKHYAAIDRIRTPHLTADRPGPRRSYPPGSASSMKDGEHVEILGPQAGLPLNESGALPGSVWTISTSGLQIPAEVISRLNTDKHYAAFPPEIPKRIIEGWCPERICAECGEGRRPLVERERMEWEASKGRQAATMASITGTNRTRLSGTMTKAPSSEIVGEWCACNEPIPTPRGTNSPPDISLEVGRAGMARSKSYLPPRIVTRDQQRHWAVELKNHQVRRKMEAQAGSAFEHYIRTDRIGGRPPAPELLEEWMGQGWLTTPPPFDPPPTTPALVLDPFGGAGTTALAARVLGRDAISTDISTSYTRLALWRVFASDHATKLARKWGKTLT